MGRPTASPENRAFAVSFAHAVTKKTHSRFDFVARSGPHSLFAGLAKMFPAYARTEDGRGFRDGISEVQLNKELQKNGFARVRDRRTRASKRSEDPTGAGMYLFSHVKWRDPTDIDDREELTAKYNELVEKHPLIMLSCKHERFMDLAGKFHQEWAVITESMEMELEDESEQDTQPAHRSTSVSPVVHGNESQHFVTDLHALAAMSESNAGQPASPPHLPVANLGASNQAPFNLVSPAYGISGTQHSLSALQNQLTSSLLAVTLAKQQLQQQQQATKPLVCPYSSNSTLPQTLVSSSPMPSQPIQNLFSPFGALNFTMPAQQL